MTKTPADVKSSDYCYEHGLYHNGSCPDCRLEEWDTWMYESDKQLGKNGIVQRL